MSHYSIIIGNVSIPPCRSSITGFISLEESAGLQQQASPETYQKSRRLKHVNVGFTLTIENDFRLFFREFKNNFHESLRAILSSHAVM